MVYDIAGMRVKIENRCSFTNEFCKDYLSEDQLSPCDMQAKVTNEEFYEEKAQSEEYSDGYIENICLYRKICLQMPKFDRFLLHSAVLTVDGKAYAFSGRSGAGKSTHTGLWLEYVDGAEILNGDKPIIEKRGEEFFAHGTPWQGKENRGRKGEGKIEGICFIEQAKENKIRSLSVSEFTDRMITQLLIPTEEEAAVKALELFDGFVKAVPAYVLQCDISKEAVQTSYFAMTGKKL